VIISASRRTDIPALYADWFAARLQAGFCLVRNPFNAKQVARVELGAEEAEAFVFWTRHARPFFDTLAELERRQARFYFQYTVTGYGPPLEPRLPPLERAVETFIELARRCPAGAVVWRYDPIVLGEAFPVREHLVRFAGIARRLEGHTRRVVVSLLDGYRKTARRVGHHYAWGREVLASPHGCPELPELLRGLAALSREHGMRIDACAEPVDLEPYGIGRAKCIDDELLTELYGGDWARRKDPGQRPSCACIQSKDIGAPDTCTFGCAYCYATRSDELAKRRHDAHDPSAETLL
jgi:hypothetical protein